MWLMLFTASALAYGIEYLVPFLKRVASVGLLVYLYMGTFGPLGLAIKLEIARFHLDFHPIFYFKAHGSQPGGPWHLRDPRRLHLVLREGLSALARS